ncbi:hypothetical protein MTR_4g072155 [Medicago truncatula]|uniref:Uncharacterized protein n=1 Tax=Medicago truncatula TaxID=3880 RepID=A0A072UM68_MEDTR|nr:hypothetical protein MTR_4g072155 [Medicago truncatula]
MYCILSPSKNIYHFNKLLMDKSVALPAPNDVDGPDILRLIFINLNKHGIEASKDGCQTTFMAVC